MLTVSIMSMQRIFNYGSTLQAYALRQLISAAREDLNVRFVDYRPGPLIGAPRGKPSMYSRAAGRLRHHHRVRARTVDKVRFYNHKLKYARNYLPLIGLTRHPYYDLHADLQVIGSDEVFNCFQSNVRVGYSRDLFGHQSPASRIVSYAASFGNTTLDKIDSHGLRDSLAEDLSRFSAISVRDRNSAAIVKSLTGRIPEIHLDPTLVYDLASAKGTQAGPNEPRDRYIMVYGYSGRFSDAENMIIHRYAKAHRAQVWAFGGVQQCADRFVDCDPFELMGYFRHAAGVVTDTFHGTIFSIINETPFATIVRRSTHGHYGNEEKLVDLLNRFGLRDRVLRPDADLDTVMERELDFARIHNIREEEAARTHNYISGVLSECKDVDES